MPNAKNLKIVEEVSEKFSNARGIFFTNYKGMTVEQINNLRRELHAANVEYKVAKKTLSRIAAKNAGFESIDELMDGQTGIAFSYDDPSSPGKIISEYIKKNKLDNLNITGCIFEREIFGADKVGAIISLPSKDELLSSLVGTLAAPMSNLVATLRGSMSQLVGVLKSLSEKK
ncbi:MAG: 50S ribosomal protein L10 [Candidatus Marinimicrobia bacterium]|nr:50S ribosomal protein L10 [Candidatus Neomarinimicrobiota bacterium]RKY61625.1 MAG: 50S ribosomal protein L10 [Candidatus Neomarinimicrobiota bacterium]